MTLPDDFVNTGQYTPNALFTDIQSERTRALKSSDALDGWVKQQTERSDIFGWKVRGTK